MERVFIKTFGCQMNIYDSERMEGALASEGFEIVHSENEADYVVINTCSVRKHAEDRALSYAGNHIKDSKVIISGCMAQKMKDTLFKRYPSLYAVIGTSNFDSIADIIRKGAGGSYTDEKDSYGPGFLTKKNLKGHLAIMKGCDNYCSYCIVPYVRGREVSREPSDIIKELEQMAGRGTKEVMLLGQNVNSYKGGGITFPELLRKAARVDGIERIRFMTSHPKDLTQELVDTVASEKKLCSHFHLPMQSGSGRILKAMNRKYTPEDYARKAEMIRGKIQDVSLTTDILAGFPGETEDDFMETVAMMRDITFDDAYVFKYSERDGTAASEMEDDVDDKEKLRRVNYILDLKKKMSDDINRKYVGREMEVFVYGKSPKLKGGLEGTTGNNKKVHVQAPEEKSGTIINVRLVEQKGIAFKGEMI